MKGALFIDRDGTINKDCPYCHSISDLKIYRDIPSLIRSYKEKGFLVIVVSNQSGIGRGFFSTEECDAFNEAIQNELDKEGARIDKFYYCPHRPEENCSCRKPNTGLIDRARAEFDIDLTKSIVIGDRDDIDGEMARRLGMEYIILKRENSP